MKNINKITGNAGRAFIRVLALLSVAIFFIGCTFDTDGKEDYIPSPDSDKAVVHLTIKTPQPILPGTRASQTIAETNISAVRIIVFTEESGQYLYRYSVAGTELASDGNGQTKFQADLRQTDLPVKLVIITNAGGAFNTAIQPRTPLSQVREELTLPFTVDGITGDIPMYGETDLPGGLSATGNYTVPVNALRAIARVDVIKALNAGSADFIIDKVYVFRAKDKLQLMPDDAGDPSSPKVTSPSVPDDASALASPVVKTYTGGTDQALQIYVPESVAATTNDEKVRGVTTIVVGGRFDGENNPVTYYRVDFNSGMTGHPFGQILRNYKYIFNIKNVSSPGWDNPEDAANNLSTSMIAEVVAWEDFASDIYVGDDKLALSSRSISLRYIAGREKRLDVESTVVYSIQWLDGSGNPTGQATSSHGVEISNDNFDAWISQDPGDNEYTTHLVFRTRNNNHLGEVISDKLRVTAGKWSVDVTVKQDNSAVYSGRFVNVLTVSSIGDLGVDMVSSDASGLAMRKVLDVNFAPAGTIRIGGFSYTRIPNTSGYVGTSNSDNLAVLKRIFGTQDVIYFPYDVNISSAVADLLLEWLDASPNRVLFMGMDTDATNKNLRLKPRIANEGTFGFSSISTVTTNYITASKSEAAKDFFEGPFGTVQEGAAINRADNIAGYIMNYSNDVIPLITSDKAGYEGYVFFSLNPANRIIYHGDAQLFQTSQMSNNNGNITSEADKLMANTWAWIIEQVIYGAD